MAKKATTGVPTRRKRSPEREERTYLSRAESEARMQRRILIGMGAALGVVLIVLLVGIVFESIIYPNQAVAVVDGQSIVASDFEKRVRLERWQTGQELLNVVTFYGPQALTDQSSPFYQQYVALQPGQEYQIGRQVRELMIEEALIAREAEARSLTVDEAAIDARIEEYFGYNPDPEEAAPTVEPTVTPTPIVSPTPSPAPTETPEPEETPLPTLTPMPTSTPAPTLTAEELADRYQEISGDYLSEASAASGLSRNQLREIFGLQVLRTMLQDEITADIDSIEEQVNARHILVDTEEEANDILAALAEGEAFEELAASASKDTGSGINGGELGWAGRGRYVAEFEDAVFNAEVGEVVGPIQSEFGYHIIQVHAHEDRELTESELESKRTTAFNEWLTTATNGADVERSSDYLDRVPADPTIYDLGLAG